MPSEIVSDLSGNSFTLVRQSDPNACGVVAVINAILARMFICPKNPPTETSLLAQLGLSSAPDGGLQRSQVSRLLTLNNIPYEYMGYPKVDEFIAAMRSHAKPKTPVILHVAKGTKENYTGHWVTAVSTKGDFMTVLDPMYGLQNVYFDLMPNYAISSSDSNVAGAIFSGQSLLTK
jgi:hypothetical protein